MNLPQAVVALLPPKKKKEKEKVTGSRSAGCVGSKRAQQACGMERSYDFKWNYGNSRSCQEAGRKLGRNEERDVSRKTGKVKKKTWGDRNKERAERGVDRWSLQSWQFKRQTKTLPNPSGRPSLISAPSNPHCWWLYGGTAQKETNREAQLPLTANPLPPGGSKPRGQRSQMSYSVCVFVYTRNQQTQLWYWCI